MTGNKVKEQIHRAYGELDDEICHEECLPKIDAILDGAVDELLSKAKSSSELSPMEKEEYCRGCYKKETECPSCLWYTERWISVSELTKLFGSGGKST